MIASSPSAFFEFMPCTESKPLDADIPDVRAGRPGPAEPPSVGTVSRDRPVAMPVHQIMQGGGADGPESEPQAGRGMNYGTKVHRLAQMMANGFRPDAAVEREFPETVQIRKMLAGMPEGAVFTEVPCALHLEKNGRRVVLNGTVDLLVVGGDSVHIYDWKTDVTKRYSDDYRTQLSVYSHAVGRHFPGKRVHASILWLSAPDAGSDRIDPISEDEIAEKAWKTLVDSRR